MPIFVGQRISPDLNLTINDDAEFSSSHRILHHVSSYDFQKYKKFFQAGNFNANMRPDMMFFSIWGVYSKGYQKHHLCPVKTANTVFTSTRRLVWWNVILSMKISVVLLALTVKGQTILNAPRKQLLSDNLFQLILFWRKVAGRFREILTYFNRFSE